MPSWSLTLTGTPSRCVVGWVLKPRGSVSRHPGRQQAAGSGHRCAARTVLLCNTCIITSWTAATSFLSACLHYSSPYSTPVCLQDVELEIQVLPGNMDKAWIPDFIENKLKEALCFSVSRALLISPGTAQAVQHRHFRQRRAAQGSTGLCRVPQGGGCPSLPRPALAPRTCPQRRTHQAIQSNTAFSLDLHCSTCLPGLACRWGWRTPT